MRLADIFIERTRPHPRRQWHSKIHRQPRRPRRRTRSLVVVVVVSL
jgi:hypothetical protein